MAVAEAFLAERYGFGLVNQRTVALIGDGRLQEGIGQEVISLVGHLRLDKLCFPRDDNLITDDGPVGLVQSDDVPACFRASGWHVQEVDGHDQDARSRASGQGSGRAG